MLLGVPEPQDQSQSTTSQQASVRGSSSSRQCLESSAISEGRCGDAVPGGLVLSTLLVRLRWYLSNPSTALIPVLVHDLQGAIIQASSLAVKDIQHRHLSLKQGSRIGLCWAFQHGGQFSRELADPSAASRGGYLWSSTPIQVRSKLDRLSAQKAAPSSIALSSPSNKKRALETAENEPPLLDNPVAESSDVNMGIKPSRKRQTKEQQVEATRKRQHRLQEDKQRVADDVARRIATIDSIEAEINTLRVTCIDKVNKVNSGQAEQLVYDLELPDPAIRTQAEASFTTEENNRDSRIQRRIKEDIKNDWWAPIVDFRATRSTSKGGQMDSLLVTREQRIRRGLKATDFAESSRIC